MNSKVFIVTTTSICVIALSLDLNLESTQTAIKTSDKPIRMVKGLE